MSEWIYLIGWIKFIIGIGIGMLAGQEIWKWWKGRKAKEYGWKRATTKRSGS